MSEPRVIDLVRLAALPRGELRATGYKGQNDATCWLCGGPISHGDWRVTIDKRPAHTHCAFDKGWGIS